VAAARVEARTLAVRKGVVINVYKIMNKIKIKVTYE